MTVSEMRWRTVGRTTPYRRNRVHTVEVIQIACAVLLVSILALWLSGCAQKGLALKQNGVITIQAVEVSLGNAQDFERNAYINKLIPGLDSTRHAAISRLFVKAFDDQIRAATALKAWKAGDPSPSSLTELYTDVQATLTAVSALTGGVVADLITKVQAVVQNVSQVIASVGSPAV